MTGAGPTTLTRMATPVVRLDDVTVGYGSAPVCPPVSFTLDPGHALALVGANGSGKSTVLKTVLGLLTPMAGRVQVLGRDVDEREADFRREVAGVLDDDAYFPALTVAEHLYLTARGHGVLEARERVAELLEEFGLSDHAQALPVALSSGQRRRLLLAAGLVRPRSLLVLDEPEQRLDQRMRTRLAARLRDETAAGGAVLLATHDPDLVVEVCDAAVHVGEQAVEVLAPAEAAARIARVVL